MSKIIHLIKGESMKFLSTCIIIVIAFIVLLVPIVKFNKSDLQVKKQVVKLLGQNGQCSGIRVKHNDKFYVLSAAHCISLSNKGQIIAKSNDGKTEILQVIYEDIYSDLLVLSNPRNEGVDIAESYRLNEKIYTMTHGGGKPSYRTDGELLNVEYVQIPIFEIKGNEADCKVNQPKFSIENIEYFIFRFKACVMSTYSINSTAKVVPGSSGGGVFNLSGELIGIVSATGDFFSLFVRLDDIKRTLDYINKRS